MKKTEVILLIVVGLVIGHRLYSLDKSEVVFTSEVDREWQGKQMVVKVKNQTVSFDVRKELVPFSGTGRIGPGDVPLEQRKVIFYSPSETMGFVFTFRTNNTLNGSNDWPAWMTLTDPDKLMFQVVPTNLAFFVRTSFTNYLWKTNSQGRKLYGDI